MKLIHKQIIARESGEPYLIRYSLPRMFWGLVRFNLHHILLSDYDCMHDHPWSFISIILKGGYFERTPKHKKTFKAILKMKLNLPNIRGGREEWISIQKKWYRPLSVLYRPAEWAHALELPPGKDCWTLVIMFKRRREWGFWSRAMGWIKWSDYKPTQKCE